MTKTVSFIESLIPIALPVNLPVSVQKSRKNHDLRDAIECEMSALISYIHLWSHIEASIQET